MKRKKMKPPTPYKIRKKAHETTYNLVVTGRGKEGGKSPKKTTKNTRAIVMHLEDRRKRKKKDGKAMRNEKERARNVRVGYKETRRKR